MLFLRDKSYEGMVKVLGDLTHIKSRYKGFRNGKAHNMSVVLKEGYPIKARGLVRVHLLKSSVQFLFSEGLG